MICKYYNKKLLIIVVDVKWNERIRSTKFMVNRPFMFAIEHKPIRMPLFLGSVRKPSKLVTEYIKTSVAYVRNEL